MPIAMRSITYLTMDTLWPQTRDPHNQHPIEDPLYFTVGIPIEVEVVLFKSRDTGTDPYPLPEGVVKWFFKVDNDFDRTTPPLFGAVNEDITVTQTETETRFTIECTDVGFDSLLDDLAARGITDWREIPGYMAEIAGYDENDCCLCVIHIDDVRIRNLMLIGDLPESE